MVRKGKPRFFDGSWLVDVLKSDPDLEEMARIVSVASKPRGVADRHPVAMVFLGKIGSRYVTHVARWGGPTKEEIPTNVVSIATGDIFRCIFSGFCAYF